MVAAKMREQSMPFSSNTPKIMDKLGILIITVNGTKLVRQEKMP